MWHSGFLHNTSFIVSLTDTNAPFHRRAETQRWCKIWCGERTRCFWQVKLCYSGFVETKPTNEAAKWEHVQHSSQREWVTGEKYIHIHCYLVPSVTWREESHLTTAILEKYLIGEGRSTSSPAFCQGHPTLHNATPQHTGQVNVMKEIVSLMQFQSSSWNFEPPQLFHLLFRCNLNSKKMAWRSHASSCRLMIIK